MADRLHLNPKHRQVLEALLRKHLPGVEVWACGSRVSGRSHDGSDLDLVLRGPDLKEIPIDRLGDFEEAVREPTIPFLVDARDWARLPERFHREIERHHVALVAGDESSGCSTPKAHFGMPLSPALDGEWIYCRLEDCMVAGYADLKQSADQAALMPVWLFPA